MDLQQPKMETNCNFLRLHESSSKVPHAYVDIHVHILIATSEAESKMDLQFTPVDSLGFLDAFNMCWSLSV